MRALVFAAIAGALFALGLVVSGMTDPARVVAFLDVGGHWDPSLALVMLGAIAVHAPLVGLARQRSAPVFGSRFHWPEMSRIDVRLIVGAALFGIGWGLSGYCPGPALVSVVGGGSSVLVFVGGLVGGIALTRLICCRD